MDCISCKRLALSETRLNLTGELIIGSIEWVPIKAGRGQCHATDEWNRNFLKQTASPGPGCAWIFSIFF